MSERLAWLAAQEWSDTCVDWPWGISIGDEYPRAWAAGKKKCVSHLALEAAGRPRPEAPNDHALHSCDRPLCINPRHLRWGSRLENAQDAVLRGRYALGEETAKSAVSDEVRAQIVAATASSSQREVARAFGVSRGVVRYSVDRLSQSRALAQRRLIVNPGA